MKRKIAWMMILVLLQGTVAVPLLAQQIGESKAETSRGQVKRDVVLARPADVIFIDSRTFDRKLRKLLKAETETIAVDFAEKPSPNKLPERLDAWLDAIEKHGGTVEVEPSEPTRGLASVLVYLAGVVISAAKRSALYGPTRNYDAAIYFSPVSGLVERIVFSRRANSRHLEESGSSPEESWLILPNEVPELSLQEKDWNRAVRGTRGPSLGPRVSVIEPKVVDRPQGLTIITWSPLALRVKFEANHSPVDMQSLKLSAHRMSFPRKENIDLTNRIRDYVKRDMLSAVGLRVPRGRYLIELIISDDQGYETIETFRLEVLARPR